MSGKHKKLASRARRHKLSAHDRGYNRHHPALSYAEKADRRRQEFDRAVHQPPGSFSAPTESAS